METGSRIDLDVGKLKREINAVAESIRLQKREIRTTHHESWDRNLWADLRRSKARATLLCTIRAHGRGRLHMQRCMRSHAHLGLPQIEQFTLERQGRFIGDRWREFALGPTDERGEVCETKPVTPVDPPPHVQNA